MDAEISDGIRRPSLHVQLSSLVQPLPRDSTSAANARSCGISCGWTAEIVTAEISSSLA